MSDHGLVPAFESTSLWPRWLPKRESLTEESSECPGAEGLVRRWAGGRGKWAHPARVLPVTDTLTTDLFVSLFSL